MVCVIISCVYCYNHCHLQVNLETEPLFREKRTNKAEQPTHPPAISWVLTQNLLWWILYWNNDSLEIKEGLCCGWSAAGCQKPLWRVFPQPLCKLWVPSGVRWSGFPSPAQMHCLLFGVGRLLELLFLSFRWKSCQTGDASATCQHSSRFFVIYCCCYFSLLKMVSGNSWWLKADPKRSQARLQEEPLLEVKLCASS